MNSIKLTAARLREVFDYNPKTGHFLRRTASENNRFAAGTRAGTRQANGYWRIQIDGRPYRAHRLAWLYVYGDWPSSPLDHINGRVDDDRIDNLRAVTVSENMQNQRQAHIDSQSKLLGARPYKGKWMSEIRVNGTYHYLGRFPTAQDAHRAYVAAKRRLHATCTI